MSSLPSQISHYRLLHRLGRGGMGEVYRALDENLAREVAIKILPEVARSREGQLRLIREARAAASLNHPGVVTVHEVGEWEGRVYLVMELVEGETFSELASRGVNPTRAAELVAEAADALSAAHSKAILHRDIKSDNLMVKANGQVKVLDFGLARGRGRGADVVPSASEPAVTKLGTGTVRVPTGSDSDAVRVSPLAETIAQPDGYAPTLPASTLSDSPTPSSPLAVGITPSDRVTHRGGVVGTPAYMSPEQARGDPLTVRSEVYSLGIVLYELLTNQRPFDRDSLPGTLAAIQNGRAQSPSQLQPERRIPPAIDAVCSRAMAREPNERYPDTGALAGALRAAYGRQRYRAVSLLIATFAAIVVVLGGIIVANMNIRSEAAAVSSSGASSNATPARIESLRRITFEAGCEEHPSFFPSGDTLLFNGVIDNDYELQRIDLKSGKRSRLTHTASWDYGGVVSPDGQYIAYIHLSKLGGELRLLPSSGDVAAEPRILGQTMSYPVWGPQGLLVGEADGRVVQYQPAGTKSVISEGAGGSHVRYALRDAREDIYVMWRPATAGDVKGFYLGHLGPDGKIRDLDRNLWDGLALGSEGGSLYYGRKTLSRRSELVRRRLPDGAPEVLPWDVDSRAGITISHDGRRLAFSTCSSQIAVSRLGTGKAPEPLFPRANWVDQNPVSLDSSRILFTSDRSGQHQVWLANLRTGETSAVTSPDTHDGFPSPDRTLIAYSDRRRKGIFIKSLKDGPERRLTDGVTDTGARFSRDGKLILFTRAQEPGGSRIYSVSVEGGAPTPVSALGTHSPFPSPVADRFVYLERHNNLHRVVTASTDGSNPRVVPSLPPSGYSNPTFSKDGTKILLVRAWMEAIEAPVDGPGSPRVVWKAGLEGLQAVAYGASSHGYLATVAYFEGDIWLAEGYFP